MPITQEQLEARRHHIGASDVATVLGLNHYKTPYDLWLEKTGRLVPSPAGEAAHWGNRLEYGVLDEAESILGPMVRNVTVPAPGSLPICANLDGQLTVTGEPVDAKTSGLFGPLPAEWGEPGTDEIPEEYIVQLQVQMYCTNRNVGHVAAFLGGRGFCLYRIERNRDLQEAIIARCVEFWDKNVKLDFPPDNCLPSIEAIAKCRRVPETTADVDPALVAAWLEAKEARSAAEKAEDERKAALLAAMGDAEAGLAGDMGSVTFLEQSRSGIDAARLKEELPDIHAKYAKVSTFRVLRFSKPKKGKR